MDAISLDELLHRLETTGDRMPMALALLIVCQLCDHLQAAHARGQPHARPTPATVSVSTQGGVHVDDRHGAPCRGADDVAACARLLHGLLVGQHPGRGSDAPLEPAKNRAPDLPEPLSRTLTRGLEADGYEEAGTFGAALTELTRRYALPAEPAVLSEYIHGMLTELPGDASEVDPEAKDQAAREVARRRTLRATVVAGAAAGTGWVVWVLLQLVG